MPNVPLPEREYVICEKGGGGLILPLLGDWEQDLPDGLRAPAYFIGLGWCFMGVALISDVFMGAIETITSKKKRKPNSQTGRLVTTLVWNPTVANMTLMALGSSAPEIMLSIIELLGNDFFSGDLGPSTIVGSAAFNMFCITAVCVVAIPEKEYRTIKEMPVYVVTATASIFAYLWLLIIIMGISPEIIEIWEGLLTLLFFPLLVIVAYMADKGYFSKAKPEWGVDRVVGADITKEELANLEAQIRRKHGANLTDHQVSKFINCEYEPRISRAKQRVAATRRMTAGRRVSMITQMTRTCSLNSVVPFHNSEPEILEIDKDEDCTHTSIIEFEAVKYAVLENVGEVNIAIRRRGNDSHNVLVHFKTRDGTAKANTDYHAVDTWVEFKPGVDRLLFQVKIIDDAANEDDEEFCVDLIEVTSPSNGLACLGLLCTATVVIIDDDLPGVLHFPDECLAIPEAVADRTVDITINRALGSTGRVGCKYRTEDSTAIAGADYEQAQGNIVFEPGQMTTTVTLNIKGGGRYDRSEMFRLMLYEPFGGARFDPKKDGGADSSILTLEIKSGQASKARVDRLMANLQGHWNKAKVGRANWREQFVEALYVNGGDADPDFAPSFKDWTMHAVLLPWKLLFALVPPTDYLEGWACFGCALIMIGGVTAIIGDMAGLFGCVMGVPNAITAITFVALGTSLPDLFASMSAATQDPWADASIGNVTGSNSVNVFLGLGLPWLIGAVRWSTFGPNDKWRRKYEAESFVKEWQHGAFVVRSGNLGFSVMIFTCFAIFTIILLCIRRKICRGELGGPTGLKYLTASLFVAFWISYIALSSWYITK